MIKAYFLNWPGDNILTSYCKIDKIQLDESLRPCCTFHVVRKKIGEFCF